jgi:cytochrome c peroxidase
MAGQADENAVAQAVDAGFLELAWQILADRLRGIPGYVDRFVAAFSDVDASADIKITHAANALAAFQTVAFRADQSRFDEFLRTGAAWLLSTEERRGMNLFYNKAGCANCHSGPLLTDQQFHAIAMPQIGPGKGHGNDTSYEDLTGYAEKLEDEGRFAVTGDPFDVFKFRTPSLRNITETAPYGHDGAFATLEGVVRHHLDPIGSLNAYLPVSLAGSQPGSPTEPINCEHLSVASGDDDKAQISRDSWVHCTDRLRQRVAAANELEPVTLTDREIQDLIAFLGTLTDNRAERLQRIAPDSLPSGLALTR